MRIRWAMICREFEDADDGVNLYDVGIDNYDYELGPGDELPMKLPLTIAYCVGVEQAEFGTTGHLLTARMFGPEMQLLGGAEFDVDVSGPGPRHPANKEGTVFDSLFVPLLVVADGEYVIELQIDQELPSTTLGCSGTSGNSQFSTK